jgi:alkylhydroperoxidase family enzyme
MSRITMIPYPSANRLQKEAIDSHVEHYGKYTNMKSTLIHSLPAFQALMQWYPLRNEARTFLEEREINLFCHAISTQNRCLVCSTFFRKILIDSGDDPDRPALSAREELLIAFGGQCVTNPRTMSGSLFGQLKAEFSEEQIVLLTAFAGLMIATNLINNVLDVELDEYLESYTRR